MMTNPQFDSDPFDSNQSPQIQQRLLQLSNQMGQIQAQLDLLATTTRAHGDQVAALTSELTDPLAADSTRTKLAELTTHLVDNEEQLKDVRQILTETMTREQEILQQLRQLNEHQVQLGSQQEKLREQQHHIQEQQSQLEPMLRTAVQSDQLQEVTQSLANQSQIEEVLSTIKKLNRTQFKSNAITESKETQVSGAIATLQSIVNRREEAQTEQVTQTQQRVQEAKDTGRGELAAAFLPALDGLELAIAKGNELSHRLQSKQNEAALSGKARIIDLLQKNKEPIDANFWKRVRSALGGSPDADKLERNAALDMLISGLSSVDISTEPQSVTGVQSWIDGLNLVRDRFLKLYAAEEIVPIPADGQRFDPRLHVAVETEMRTDVEPETVVRVLQEGYKQRDRVLRYAEVVVARQPKVNSSE